MQDNRSITVWSCSWWCHMGLLQHCVNLSATPMELEDPASLIVHVEAASSCISWTSYWGSILSPQDENNMHQDTFKCHITHDPFRMDQWVCLFRINFNAVDPSHLYLISRECVWLARSESRKCFWPVRALLETRSLGLLRFWVYKRRSLISIMRWSKS